MYTYVFDLSYKKRTMEKRFIKDIITQFDKELSGIHLAVCNNIYSLEFLLVIDFERNNNFESWLEQNYPDYISKRKYNYYLRDIFCSMGTNGYSFAQVIHCKDVDKFITAFGRGILFVFPEEATANEIWRGGIKKYNTQAFLCHCSKDKEIIDIIHNELQKNEIETFYDKFQIKIGDNIRSKIEQNLLTTKVGIVAVSNYFDTSTSKWIEDEVNYFKSKGVSILPLNLGVNESKMKKICGDIRFVDWNNDNIEEVVDVIKELYFKGEDIT